MNTPIGIKPSTHLPQIDDLKAQHDSLRLKAEQASMLRAQIAALQVEAQDLPALQDHKQKAQKV
jgi:hypothetical protein